MFDPTTRKLYASTIPRGPQQAMMKHLAEEADIPQAPEWYKRKEKNNPKRIDAEDGVWFNFEFWGGTVQQGTSPESHTWPYPTGSIMAVWGSDTGNLGDPGKEWKPCTTCQGMARSLGVNFMGKGKPDFQFLRRLPTMGLTR